MQDRAAYWLGYWAEQAAALKSLPAVKPAAKGQTSTARAPENIDDATWWARRRMAVALGMVEVVEGMDALRRPAPVVEWDERDREASGASGSSGQLPATVVAGLPGALPVRLRSGGMTTPIADLPRASRRPAGPHGDWRPTALELADLLDVLTDRGKAAALGCRHPSQTARAWGTAVGLSGPKGTVALLDLGRGILATGQTGSARRYLVEDRAGAWRRFEARHGFRVA